MDFTRTCRLTAQIEYVCELGVLGRIRLVLGKQFKAVFDADWALWVSQAVVFGGDVVVGARVNCLVEKANGC